MHACTHTCNTYTQIHIYMAKIHTHTYIHIHTYLHINPHMHTYMTQIYIHTCS